MERTEFIQKMHDLRAMQIEKKKNYKADVEQINEQYNAEINNIKAIYEGKLKEKQDERKAVLKQINDLYHTQQSSIDDKMLEVKLEYFKDHELEKI